MIRLLLLCFFALFARGAFADTSVTMTLPDDGSYSYWIQSRAGSLSLLPVNVSDQSTLTVHFSPKSGDRVVLLDSATGRWAEQTISLGADDKPAPITFALGDFHPMMLPAFAPPLATAPPVDTDSGGAGWLPKFAALLFVIGGGILVWYYRGRRVFHQPGKQNSSPDPPNMVGERGQPLMSRRDSPAAISRKSGRSVSPNPPEFHRGPEIPIANTAALIGEQGLVAGSTFTLTAGEVTIGRDGENEIVLAENTVSRYHARLKRQSNGQFALTDLGSANGVYVNGTRVQRAILRSGDQIKVGDSFFRFQVSVEAT